MLPASRNPFFSKEKHMHWLIKYTLVPILVLLSPIIATTRIVIGMMLNYLFGVIGCILEIGSKYPEPTSAWRNKIQWWYFVIWGRLILLVEGLLLIQKNKMPKSKVVVFNHTSMNDMMVGSSAFPGVGVMKHQIANLWFMKVFVRLSRSLLVYRDGNVSNSYKFMMKTNLTEQMKTSLQKVDKNILICPEGSIPATGYMLKFKSSVFRLDAPVTPACVRYNTIFPQEWTSHHPLVAMFNMAMNPFGFITIKYLEPQTIREGEDPQAFADRVGQMMAKELGYEYTEYQSQDWVYFGLGNKDKPCTEAWKRDFGWMGTLDEFCKKHKLNKHFGISQSQVRHIMPPE